MGDLPDSVNQILDRIDAAVVQQRAASLERHLAMTAVDEACYASFRQDTAAFLFGTPAAIQDYAIQSRYFNAKAAEEFTRGHLERLHRELMAQCAALKEENNG